MPGGDRTGPAGAGAMTGRGAGYCAGNSAPGLTGGVFGLGRRGGAGRGRCVPGGGGRGMGRGFFGMGRRASGYPAETSPLSEKEVLNTHAEALQRELDAVKARLDSMKD